METFSLGEMKRFSKAIFSEAVSAVNPYKKLEDMLQIDRDRLLIRLGEGSEKTFDLDTFRRIFLIGTGKASASMAQAIENILGGRVTYGLITTKYGHALLLKCTEIIEAGHPIPDQRGVEGSKKIQSLLEGSKDEDLVIFVLSGGGSSLLPHPADGITLAEKQEVTQLLLGCGANIREINTVRKHISQVKGGWLARWAYPSTVIGFILSDVVGDAFDVIGSGPTVPDNSLFEHAWKILEKYDLLKDIPSSIRRHLLLGREGKVEETPKPGDVAFKKVYNYLIGSNILALRAAAEEAISFGFNTLILSSSIVGETREAVRFHCAIAREILSSGNPLPRPACVLSGGETTVTLKGHGLGGRNQEFALTGAFEINGLEKVVLLSGGTDGTDGPTDAAGAIVDYTTIQRAQSLGLDPEVYLEDNDAYPFFQRLGDLLITGPTQTNVMDVRVLLVD
jgi:glycerate 2-kinase